MGILRSKDKYRGKVGELVFVQMNGKTYVRKKRGKMKADEKAKASWKGTLNQNARFERATSIARLLRLHVPKYSSYSHLHSRLTGKLNTLIGLDNKHPEGSKRLLPQYYHRIAEVKTNDVLDSRILEALQKADVRRTDGLVEITLKKLPLRHLPKTPEAVSVWFKSVEIDLKGTPKLVSHSATQTERIPLSRYGKVVLRLEHPLPDSDHLFVGLLGFHSFIGGEMVKDPAMNGFVYLVF
jgi:hypothetical protein